MPAGLGEFVDPDFPRHIGFEQSTDNTWELAVVSIFTERGDVLEVKLWRFENVSARWLWQLLVTAAVGRHQKDHPAQPKGGVWTERK
jgi:hypothetical protein